MVTLADVKASLFGPRTGSNAVHCDLPTNQHGTSQNKHARSSKPDAPAKHKELLISSAPCPAVSRMELVEYLWRGAKTGSNQDKEAASKYVVADQKDRPRTREASDGVLRYHVKLAHAWQPYQKR
jgi:hypothetical protein